MQRDQTHISSANKILKILMHLETWDSNHCFQIFHGYGM